MEMITWLERSTGCTATLEIFLDNYGLSSFNFSTL
jgi:hypothetical protein